MKNLTLTRKPVKNNNSVSVLKSKSNFSLSSWLTYIANRHNKVIDMGLDRIGIVIHQLDLLDLRSKVITVAGTNGKGSTCHILESIFIEAGLKVGVYTSPHLLDYTERVRIQGNILPEEKFCQVFTDIDSKCGSVKLTYFEYSTIAALQLFKQAELDVVILEVGMGGRLDATNIVDANISAITTIALDHINWLGSDREQIGYEKAGIFRSGCYAVIGEEDVPNSVNEVAHTVGANLFCYKKDWDFIEKTNHWNWKSDERNFEKLPFPKVPLPNAATALAIIDCLLKENNIISKMLSEEAIHNGILKAQLPGRFQIISQNPYIILDVAHNPHAAIYLSKKLSLCPKQKTTRVYGVVAMLADKDIKQTLSCLNHQIDTWYLASLNIIRGAKSEQLAQYVNSSYQFHTIKDAWLEVMKVSNKEDIIVVFGSFHTVSEVMKLQIKRKN